MPKKMKHRKVRRGGHLPRVSTRGTSVCFGGFGLKSEEPGLVSARQIEAARRAISRSIQRGGKVWIRVFPDHPMTKKGSEVPMGKGKGAVEYYVARVGAGRILFEMDGIGEEAAKKALMLASHKLSIKTRFVRK